uniref:Uncharacterized protein n=1 Tax=Pan paniscus TaxID=9597 RepID=A0A2R9AAQ6_PANPA
MGADFQFCKRNYEHSLYSLFFVIVYMISEVISRESEKREEERKVFKLISFEFKMHIKYN